MNNYTIAKGNRELQQESSLREIFGDYTIAKGNRELQLTFQSAFDKINYTIAKGNRELQLRPGTFSISQYYTIAKGNYELQSLQEAVLRWEALYHSKRQLGTATCTPSSTISVPFIIS